MSGEAAVPAKLAPVQAAIVELVVSFRQIDRLYDLQWTDFSRQYLVEGDKDPEVVTLSSWIGQLEASGEKGQRLSSSMRLFPSVYRGTEYQRYTDGGNRIFLRTFVREFSQPIDKKRVYVFKAASAKRDHLELFAELAFEGGKFRQCGVDGNPVGPLSEWLSVPVLSVSSRKSLHDCYFVLLSPYPLSRKSLQSWRRQADRRTEQPDAESTIRERLWPLWDPFCTDSGKDAEGKFTPLEVNSSAATTRFLRMHLVDPLDEAINRAATAQQLFERWSLEAESLAKQPKYRFACQIRALTQNRDDLRELVSGSENRDGIESLEHYLTTVEKKSRATRTAMENAGNAALRWVACPDAAVTLAFPMPEAPPKPGEPVKPVFLDQSTHPWPGADTYVLSACTLSELARTPKGKISMLQGPKERFFSNLFMGLYDDFGGDENILGHLEDVGMASLALANHLVGAEQILVDVLHKLAGKPEQSTAAVLKDRLTTAAKVGKASWTVMWIRVALPAVRAKDVKGWENLKNDLFTAPTGQKSTFDRLKDETANGIALVGYLFGLIDSIDKFQDDPSFGHGWKAITNLTSSYDKLTQLVGKAKLPEIKWSRGVFKAAKFTPVALLIGSIDCVLGLNEAFNKRNQGAVAATAAGVMGSLVAVVGGAVVGSTGVGALLVLGGMALSYGASLVERHFKDLNVFLCHSCWGNGTDHQITPWSQRLPLVELRYDIAAQNRALHEVLYGDFEIEVGRKDHGIQDTIWVAIKFIGEWAPPTTMSWSGTFALSDGQGFRRLLFPVDGSERLAKGEKVELEGALAFGARNVTGVLELDVYGDKSIVIKRSVDADLSF